jgi:hypothetical protein
MKCVDDLSRLTMATTIKMFCWKQICDKNNTACKIYLFGLLQQLKKSYFESDLFFLETTKHKQNK